MTQQEIRQLDHFWEQKDENGVTNLEKTRNAKVIRRIATTDKTRSFEESGRIGEQVYPLGVVVRENRLIGFGIHIYNEDVYPLQSFEIYLRGCDLTGELDLSDCEDLVFVDVYRNHLTSVRVRNAPSLRILGLQDNRIQGLDPKDLKVCQGIDIGKNLLTELDVSENTELVELYVNDNQLTSIDLSQNTKLKYFYCHNNHLRTLDTRNNPLLRHLDASGNPMKSIRSLAPQTDRHLPLEVYAGEGGTVGLKYYPVYNAQWKETGEWRQSYHAVPEEGYRFCGWLDAGGVCLREDPDWIDTYGESRILYARFEKNRG